MYTLLLICIIYIIIYMIKVKQIETWAKTNVQVFNWGHFVADCQTLLSLRTLNSRWAIGNQRDNIHKHGQWSSKHFWKLTCNVFCPASQHFDDVLFHSIRSTACWDTFWSLLFKGEYHWHLLSYIMMTH